MPFRKKTTFRRKRPTTNYRKRNVPTRRSLRPTRSLGKTIGIPDRMFVKLKYVQSFYMNYTSGNPTVKEFRVNSPYDPDYTATGHQPLYYDQYQALYKRQRTYGCKYNITIMNYDTAAASEVIVTLKEQTAVLTNWDTICEQTYTQCRNVDIEGSGRSQATIKGYANMAKITGNRKSTIATDMDYQSLMNANPLRQAFISLQQRGMAGIAGNVYVKIELIYFTQLFDRIMPASS